MDLTRRAWRFVASRRFATVVLLSWIGLLIVWVVPFQIYGLPASQVRAIVLTEPFFLLVYAMLLAADLACMIARLPARWAESRGAGPGAFARGAVATTANATPHSIADRVRAGRYRIVSDNPTGGTAVRRPLSALGSAVLHLGIVLLVIGIALWEGPYTTFRGTAAVAEGESFDSSAPRAFADVASGDSSSLPRLRFTVGRITPEFHEDMLLFTRLEAEVTDADKRTFPVRLSDPWFVAADTMVAIEDFGYAPVVRAQSNRGGSTQTAYKLRAFPAGTKDSLEIAGLGASGRYRVAVEIFGDYRERDGRPGSASFNLRDPRLRIAVTRIASNGTEKRIIDGRLVRLNEPITLPDGTITFENVSHYGVFRVTRSPAGPVVLVALLLVCVGAAARLVWPRAVVEWRPDADGGTAIAVWRDVYGSWDAERDRLAASAGTGVRDA